LVLKRSRLLTGIIRLVEQQIFSAEEILLFEQIVSPLRQLREAGAELRGNLEAVEELLGSVVENPADRRADALLDWVDIRDLVTVARATTEAPIYREIERRIQRRGPHQRAQAARPVGVSVPFATSAASESFAAQPAAAEPSLAPEPSSAV